MKDHRFEDSKKNLENIRKEKKSIAIKFHPLLPFVRFTHDFRCRFTLATSVKPFGIECRGCARTSSYVIARHTSWSQSIRRGLVRERLRPMLRISCRDIYQFEEITLCLVPSIRNFFFTCNNYFFLIKMKTLFFNRKFL